MDNSAVILIAVVIAIIIIGFILKKKSVSSIPYPEVFVKPAKSQETKKLPYKSWEGEYEGIKYDVENLGDTPEGEHLITVYVHLDEPLDISIEVNARDIVPDVSRLPFSSDIKALLDMGVTCIDINHNTNWIAAEVPDSVLTSSISEGVRRFLEGVAVPEGVSAVDHAFVELIMKHLAHIYKNAKRKEGE